MSAEVSPSTRSTAAATSGSASASLMRAWPAMNPKYAVDACPVFTVKSLRSM